MQRTGVPSVVSVQTTDGDVDARKADFASGGLEIASEAVYGMQEVAS